MTRLSVAGLYSDLWPGLWSALFSAGFDGSGFDDSILDGSGFDCPRFTWTGFDFDLSDAGLRDFALDFSLEADFFLEAMG